MPTAFNTISDELRKQYAGNQEKALADNTSFYATQTDSTNKLYDAQVDKQSKAYEDSYRENAIQKLINERQVAENMANLGLTNSGLNRTQQTAVQLSYANAKAGIDRQKQSAIADINLTRTQALDTIEQNRISSEATIKQNFDNMINETAQSIYKDQLAAETERINAKPQNIINSQNGVLSRKYDGSLSQNKVSVTYNDDGTTTYLDRVTGYTSTFKSSVNPYTNDDNAVGNSDTALAWKKYKYFTNGYQPKGIFYEGKDLGWVTDSGKEAYINGNWQKVHKASKDGTEWIWDGRQNKYRPYEEV